MALFKRGAPRTAETGDGTSEAALDDLFRNADDDVVAGDDHDIEPAPVSVPEPAPMSAPVLAPPSTSTRAPSPLTAHPSSGMRRTRAVGFQRPGVTRAPRDADRPLPGPGHSPSRVGDVPSVRPRRPFRDQSAAATAPQVRPEPVAEREPERLPTSAVSLVKREPEMTPTHPSEPHLRNALWLLVLAALVALICTGLTLSGLSGGGGGSSAASTGTPTDAVVPSSPNAVAAAGAAGAAKAVFAPPVALPADGSYVTTQVLASGDLHVTHWIHSTQPLTAMTLAVPVAPGLDSATVSVSDLTVAGDGTAVTAPTRVGSTPSTVALPRAHDVYVSYDLGGVVEQDGTNPGRGLARILALSVRYPSSATPRTTQTVTGVHVLGLGCTAASASAQPKACGGPQAGVWQVGLSGRAVQDTVMAQLDLSGS